MSPAVIWCFICFLTFYFRNSFEFFVFCCISFCMFWFVWFIIGVELLIKAWGYIPIPFSTFGPNLDPRTPCLLPGFPKTISQDRFPKDEFPKTGFHLAEAFLSFSRFSLFFLFCWFSWFFLFFVRHYWLYYWFKLVHYYLGIISNILFG